MKPELTGFVRCSSTNKLINIYSGGLNDNCIGNGMERDSGNMGEEMNEATNRHDKMQRLDNRPISVQEHEDNEQIEYIKQWHLDHPKGDNWLLITLVVCVIGIVGTLSYVNSHIQMKPAPVALTLTVGCRECHKPPLTVGCRECHKPPLTLKQYRQKHQARGVDLAELGAK